jgi:hypothetical protein
VKHPLHTETTFQEQHTVGGSLTGPPRARVPFKIAGCPTRGTKPPGWWVPKECSTYRRHRCSRFSNPRPHFSGNQFLHDHTHTRGRRVVIMPSCRLPHRVCEREIHTLKAKQPSKAQMAEGTVASGAIEVFSFSLAGA